MRESVGVLVEDSQTRTPCYLLITFLILGLGEMTHNDLTYII